MKWVSKLYQKLVDSLIRFFFKDNKELLKNYGITIDPDITISTLVGPMPNVGEFYIPATDTAAFEIIQINISNNCVVIREVGTDTEFSIDSELFFILFVKKESIKTDYGKF